MITSLCWHSMALTIDQKSHCNPFYTVTFTTQSEMANGNWYDRMVVL